MVANANNIKVFNNLKDTFPHPYTHADAVWWVSANKQTEPPYTGFAIDVNGEVAGVIGIIIGTDIHRVTAEVWLLAWRKLLGKRALPPKP